MEYGYNLDLYLTSSLGGMSSFLLTINFQWIDFLSLGNFTKLQVPFFEVTHLILQSGYPIVAINKSNSLKIIRRF